MEFEKLKKVIAEVLSVDPDEITMETTFTDDLGADSLDLVEITSCIFVKSKISSTVSSKRETSWNISPLIK